MEHDSEVIAQLIKQNRHIFVASDAEPSLAKGRLQLDIPTTSSLKTLEQVKEVSETIATVLKTNGYNLNFAPVYDSPQNTDVIGNRSFGDDRVAKALEFSKAQWTHSIATTAKHFPGHGNVVGDSHLENVFINGELTELPVFASAISNREPVMMIGHITVRNNAEWSTDGYPSTLSRTIMHNLLRQKMGFSGVVITDAMNMQAVTRFPDSDILAVQAGADIVLMPNDVDTLHSYIKQQLTTGNIEYSERVKRVLKLKIALGLY